MPEVDDMYLGIYGLLETDEQTNELKNNPYQCIFSPKKRN